MENILQKERCDCKKCTEKYPCESCGKEVELNDLIWDFKEDREV